MMEMKNYSIKQTMMSLQKHRDWTAGSRWSYDLIANSLRTKAGLA